VRPRLNKLITQEAITQALNTLNTLRDFLRWGLTQLKSASLHFGHGTDNALDDCAYLISHTLYLEPKLDPVWLDARLTYSEKILLLQRLQARINQRIPVAYLVKQAWFAGLSFYIDERVLIPRSALAELIEQRFEIGLSDPDQVHAILDLGTGCACIAIACAYAFPNAQIDAVDISEVALEIAQLNIEQHDVVERVHLLRSDLFAQIQKKSYTVIISNPPYVEAAAMDTLPIEYRHEPELALRAGKDGLDCIVRILREAADYLTEDGILIVEVGLAKQALIERMPQLPFLWLEFEHGDNEVFLLTKQQLIYSKHDLAE